jgi:hypothetical protein
MGLPNSTRKRGIGLWVADDGFLRDFFGKHQFKHIDHQLDRFLPLIRLYGKYIIDRESPYTANEKAKLPPRLVCWAMAVCGCKARGSRAKDESRARRLIMFVLLIRGRPGLQIQNWSSVCPWRLTECLPDDVGTYCGRR